MTLDVEQEGDHDADIERIVENQRPADHDHDSHGGAGQGVDDRDHDLCELGRSQIRNSRGTSPQFWSGWKRAARVR